MRRVFSLLVTLLTLNISNPSSAIQPASPGFLPGHPILAGENVLMCWSPVPGAETYNVYLDDKRVATVASTCFNSSAPADSGTYRYQVSALSSAGEESVLSSYGIVTVRRLEQPEHLVVDVNPAIPVARLIWNAVPGASNYNIYRSKEGGESVFVTSVIDNQFSDTGIEVDKTYEYAVTAKDIYGTEGPRSKGVTVKVEVRHEKAVQPGPAGKKKAELSKRSVSGQFVIGAIDGAPLDRVSYLGTGRGEDILVVLPETRKIHVMDHSGNALRTIGPDSFDQAGFSFVPYKVDIGDDGNFYVSDIENAALAAFDAGGKLLWSRRIHTPEGNSEVWEGFPKWIKAFPPTPSSVLCLEKEIWVSDQQFQLIYRYSYQGEILGYLTDYKKGRDQWRFRRVGEIERVGDGRYLLTFPLVRKAIVVDADFRVLYEIGGDWRSSVAGFIGIHGVSSIPGERIMITDPGLGTIKVFSATDGEYLYDIQAARLSRPNMAVLSRTDQIWVYEAGRKQISVFRRDDTN